MDSALFDKLNKVKAYRQTRLDVANWVLNRPNRISELLDYCFQTTEEISYKATWILEFVCIDSIHLLEPHLDYFLENLKHVYRDQALRPLAKICEMLAIAHYTSKPHQAQVNLSPTQREQMVEYCFDWLITDQKVACKVYAMTTLYYLGTEYNWIHPELKNTIDLNIAEGLPAYKARGKFVLNRIRIFEKRNK